MVCVSSGLNSSVFAPLSGDWVPSEACLPQRAYSSSCHFPYLWLFMRLLSYCIIYYDVVSYKCANYEDPYFDGPISCSIMISTGASTLDEKDPGTLARPRSKCYSDSGRRSPLKILRRLGAGVGKRSRITTQDQNQ